MEASVFLILILVIAAGFLLLIAPILALVRASRAVKLSESGQDGFQKLKTRIDVLEREIRSLKALSPKAGLQRAADRPTATPPAAPQPPASASPPANAGREGQARTGHEEERIPSISSWLDMQQSRPASPPSTSPQPLPHGISKPEPSSRSERFSADRVEEILGTNWLNKLGVVILVSGVALFIGYKLQTLGPGGRDFVGFLVAAAMLGAGVSFERRQQWRILARAGIGGGWALAFFTVYAMRHLEAARVLASNSSDIILLLVVGAGMVAHTLRYRSQTVTGLAFLLAFLTVNTNRGDLSGLYANAVLVAAISIIAVSLQWYELEVFGILAAFLTHFYWLQPIIAPLPHPHGEFPGYRLSSGLLIFYWLAFLASYVTRRVNKALEENISTLAIVLNTSLFVWLMGYQSAHPEKSFEFFLATGAAEFALGQLPVTRRRRTAFIMLTLIGSGLIASAFPFKYSHQSLSVLWLVMAETLFLAGTFLREIVFRRAGMSVAFLASLQILIADTRQIIHARHMANADIPLPHLAVLFFAAALVFYFNSHAASRLRPELANRRADAEVFRVASYLAALLAVVGVWAACSKPWMAVGWAGLGLLLIYAGFRGKVREITIEAHAVALLAVLRSLFVNLSSSPHWHRISLRPVTILIVAALLYLSSRWAAGAESHSAHLSKSAPPTYTWSASALGALVIWYELQPISVALGWTLFGLALFEIGMWRKSGPLRWQAYSGFLASFARIFFVNLNATGLPGQLSPRFYTIVPLALAFYYVSDRLERSHADFFALERRFRMPAVLNYFSILTVAALVRFEFHPDWVIIGWAVLVLALLAVAWLTDRRIFLHQGLLLSFAVLFRGVAHNFYERSYFPTPIWSWYSRPFCVGLTITLLFTALPFAFRLRRKGESGEEGQGRLPRIPSALSRRPEQVLFFIGIVLLTVLLAIEISKGMVTVAWGVEGVSVFLFALAIAERSFRLTGLGLLLLCVGKIVVFDFWEMTTPDKILTAIVIGSALYGVSYLYTRNRERLRQYL
ncbi:MAG TPA: DUF2339 domain-containing protein [Terriglobia bacterium]|nr:DUF2339 domain-containing protein [Terriglobia bacterium]